MNGWRINWNFDKESYSPGESASISIWLENNSNFPLHVSEVAIAFDFGVYHLKQFVGGSIQPMNANFLGSSSLCIPDSIVGIKIFKITYRAYGFINNNWVDLGYFTTKLFFISVYPRPYYNVFLSRGIHIDLPPCFNCGGCEAFCLYLQQKRTILIILAIALVLMLLQ